MSDDSIILTRIQVCVQDDFSNAWIEANYEATFCRDQYAGVDEFSAALLGCLH